jgi:hypothetical protein
MDPSDLKARAPSRMEIQSSPREVTLPRPLFDDFVCLGEQRGGPSGRAPRRLEVQDQLDFVACSIGRVSGLAPRATTGGSVPRASRPEASTAASPATRSLVDQRPTPHLPWSANRATAFSPAASSWQLVGSSTQCPRGSVGVVRLPQGTLHMLPRESNATFSSPAPRADFPTLDRCPWPSRGMVATIKGFSS